MLNRTRPGYADARRNNGGARTGAGRPISNRYRLKLDDYLLREIVVKEFRHGQVRRVKKAMITAILDSLFQKAIGDRNVRAAKLYFDITLGKAPREGGPEKRYTWHPYLRGIAETDVMKYLA